MDDDGADAGEAEERDVIGEGLLQLRGDHGVAAVFDDDRGAGEGLDPGQRLGQRFGLDLGGGEPGGRGFRGHVYGGVHEE